MTSTTAHPPTSLSLPSLHTIVAIATCHDDNGFIAIAERHAPPCPDLPYSTHWVSADGSCSAGHYDMNRADAYRDFVRRLRII